jgi:GNAT superfamily N-acetyltransferase
VSQFSFSKRARRLFIYDITIDEALSGHGYGRAARRLAEEEARRNGLHALAPSRRRTLRVHRPGMHATCSYCGGLAGQQTASGHW